MSDRYFNSFESIFDVNAIPLTLNNPFNSQLPTIAKIAATEIQGYLRTNESSFSYSFGMNPDENQPSKGKMFGVLVVRNKLGQLGYLAAYSGKLPTSFSDSRFVPSLFDEASDDSFIGKGMRKLTEYGTEIADLSKYPVENEQLILDLKEKRRLKSIALQTQLFSHYNFLNQAQELKNVIQIFEERTQNLPPAGSGECAAPKLLQFAFENDYLPIAIAEFWWGKSPKNEMRIHKQFYPPCRDKCQPILKFMLGTDQL
jgi:tRNA pseudouridine32 synthase/23S rRNA pseudouridine746 synthase